MTEREDLAAAFVADTGWDAAARQALAGDASSRRFVRLRRGGGGTAEGVGAPPPNNDLAAFARVAELLRALDLSVPAILRADTGRGFLLVEDFGDTVFANLLDAGADPAPLYELAVDMLIALHQRFQGADDLPRYDAELFAEQAALFADLFAPAADRVAFVAAWRQALAAADALPQSLLLRDCFAGNLVHLPDRPGVKACGLLDFQDAGVGPVAYDLMSLLEDARRDVPETVAKMAIDRYLAAFPAIDRGDFETACAVLAAQRHTRIIAVFTRLAGTAGKDAYLQHLPRCRRMLQQRLAHPALADVAAWIRTQAPETLT